MITAKDTVKRTLDLETQIRLIEQVREIREISPFRRLATPGGKAMAVRVTAAGRLGWISDEHGYRYVDMDPTTGMPWPHMPWEWVEIANSVVEQEQPWDCAVVNWYGPESNLGFHVDESEHDRSRPVVTIGLGDSAIWAVRSDRESEITSCVVRSGDVTVLEGITRPWIHAITRIIPEPLLSPLGATRGRCSISMRVAGEVLA